MNYTIHHAFTNFTKKSVEWMRFILSIKFSGTWNCVSSEKAILNLLTGECVFCKFHLSVIMASRSVLSMKWNAIIILVLKRNSILLKVHFNFYVTLILMSNSISIWGLWIKITPEFLIPFLVILNLQMKLNVFSHILELNANVGMNLVQTNKQ